MTKYHFSILTPNGKVFEGAIESLIAPGASGSFGVMAAHAPMASSLQSGVVTFTQDQKDNYFAISSGILEVNEHRDVLLLSGEAVRAKNLEEAKTKAAALAGR